MKKLLAIFGLASLALLGSTAHAAPVSGATAG
jgi:hypothetical protein